jgi:cytochrome c peroxidase
MRFRRARAVFDITARCASCHAGPGRTERDLHTPAEIGTDPATASRSATKQYRSTPLQGLWQHPPYFHDGSAPTLAAVVEHYVGVMGLNLTAGQRADLIEYLKSI